MSIALAPNPRDYELYFAAAVSKYKPAAGDHDNASALVSPFDAARYSPEYGRWYAILLHFSLLFHAFILIGQRIRG
jgi:hypothetical protein